MSIKLEGFDELDRKLQDLQRRAQRLNGEHRVSFDELFDRGFLRKHTRFTTFAELLEAGGFQVETQEDFEQLDESALDAFIVASTPFASWQELSGAATQEWTTTQLGL